MREVVTGEGLYKEVHRQPTSTRTRVVNRGPRNRNRRSDSHVGSGSAGTDERGSTDAKEDWSGEANDARTISNEPLPLREFSIDSLGRISMGSTRASAGSTFGTFRTSDCTYDLDHKWPTTLKALTSARRAYRWRLLVLHPGRQHWWSRASVAVELDRLETATATSRHVNQKPTPNATRLTKNRVSS